MAGRDSHPLGSAISFQEVRSWASSFLLVQAWPGAPKAAKVADEDLRGSDDSAYPVGHAKRAEIEQQAERPPEGCQVGSELRDVLGGQAADGLDLDHEAARDEQVDPASAHRVSFVVHRDGYLATRGDSPQLEFDGESVFVGGLEEARAQRPVDLDGRADDGVGNPIRLGGRLSTSLAALASLAFLAFQHGSVAWQALR